MESFKEVQSSFNGTGASGAGLCALTAKVMCDVSSFSFLIGGVNRSFGFRDALSLGGTERWKSITLARTCVHSWHDASR